MAVSSFSSRAFFGALVVFVIVSLALTKHHQPESQTKQPRAPAPTKRRAAWRCEVRRGAARVVRGGAAWCGLAVGRGFGFVDRGGLWGGFLVDSGGGLRCGGSGWVTGWLSVGL
uniref:Uncharacterized protein n=1 Tax=Fagus sylvatica TaxID=28930 RepID=A0A2N9EGZ6_FAGSY